MATFIGVLMCSAAIIGFATVDTCVGGQCRDHSSDETALLQGKIQMNEMDHAKDDKVLGGLPAQQQAKRSDPGCAPQEAWASHSDDVGQKALSKDYYMSLLAGWVYDVPTMIDTTPAQAAGWQTVRDAEVESPLFGKDRIAIYQHNKVCVVAFSGSDDLRDWQDNFLTVTTEGCGIADQHAGFFSEFNIIMQSAAFQGDFAPFLANSENCGDGIYATGHSKGGAVASIFTYCTNRGFLPSDMPSFRVDELYTFGAPGASKTPLAADECGTPFSGKRFYVKDSEDVFDPVPPGLVEDGFRHPVMAAVQLHKDVFSYFAVFDQLRYDGSETKTPDRPILRNVSLVTTNWRMHTPSVYSERLHMAMKKESGIKLCSDNGCSVEHHAGGAYSHAVGDFIAKMLGSYLKAMKTVITAPINAVKGPA